MKKAYTEYASGARRAAKAQGVPVQELLQRLLARAKEDTAVAMAAAFALFDVDDDAGRCRHVFLRTPEFCEWLVSCAKTLDPELVPKIQGAFPGTACLHFPVSLGKWAAMIRPGGAEALGFLVCLSRESPFKGGGFLCNFDGRPADKAGAFRDLSSAEAALAIPESSVIRVWYQRLIAGLALYMECFPEQVKPGIPDDACNPNHFRRMRAVTLAPAPEITLRDGPCPHYRSGHFALLSAARYVNMRGKVVFRHGTFVKGRAETVLAPEEENEDTKGGTLT